MPLDHIDPGNEGTATVQNLGDLSAFAFVTTRGHYDFIIAFELLHISISTSCQSTRGTDLFAVPGISLPVKALPEREK